jgi:hypothetical protein
MFNISSSDYKYPHVIQSCKMLSPKALGCQATGFVTIIAMSKADCDLVKWRAKHQRPCTPKKEKEMKRWDCSIVSQKEMNLQ